MHSFKKAGSHEESYDSSNGLKYWKHLLIVEFYTNLDRYRSGHDKMFLLPEIFHRNRNIDGKLTDIQHDEISLNLQNE